MVGKRGTLVLRPDAACSNALPRILIVVDEPAVCRVLVRVLSSQYDVVASCDARDALGRVRRGERFDAIVSAVTMRTGWTGIGLHDGIHAIDGAQARRMLFVTAAPCEKRAVEEFLRRVPGVCVLDKPFDRLELLAAVVEVIKTR